MAVREKIVFEMGKLYFLILLVLLQEALMLTQEGPRVRAKREEPVLHVYGGEPAVKREFPHLVAIGYIFRFKTYWLCGGSLINKRFVLTAAHCLNTGRYGRAVIVRMGDLNLKDASDDGNAQEIRVAKRIPHPDYKYPMKYNDVGLLKLKKDAILNEFVNVACLHRSYITETRAEVVGWGLTEQDKYASGQKLNKVTLDILQIDNCVTKVNETHPAIRNRILNENLKDESMICAGVLAGGKDSCGGDSGGPLQVPSTDAGCSAEIVGIVQFGLGACGAVNTPAVYGRVSYYVPWIESIVSSN